MNQTLIIGLWIFGYINAVVFIRLIATFTSQLISYIISTSLIIILTFFVFGYRLCYCCAFYDHHNRNNVQQSLLEVEMSEQGLNIAKYQNDENVKSKSTSSQIQPQQRTYFLDSVKIFLTGLVVTYHVILAFGGDEKNSWYLIVGCYSNSFTFFSGIIAMLSQAYFMPLFFFISAYFTPISYRKKGKDAFMHDKAKRIWIPAMIETFTISPFSLIIGQVLSRSSSDIVYFPGTGVAWFLYWLLIFNWMYVTVQQDRNPQGYCEQINDNILETNDDDTLLRPFSSHSRRWLSGLFICGLSMLGFCYAMSWHSFYSMPVTYGSFVADIFFFIVGIKASEYDWFPKLHMAWPLIYIAVIVEGTLMITLQIILDNGSEKYLIIPFYMISGVFCLDMSMVVLHFFYQFGNSLNWFGTFLSRSAYGVYLIHPIIITGLTSIFVKVYNYINGYNVIEFAVIEFTNDPYTNYSESALLGPDNGSVHLCIGFIIVLVATHLICWPLAWILTKLPGLRNIL